GEGGALGCAVETEDAGPRLRLGECCEAGRDLLLGGGVPDVVEVADAGGDERPARGLLDQAEARGPGGDDVEPAVREALEHPLDSRPRPDRAEGDALLVDEAELCEVVEALTDQFAVARL